ncbi:hypothetical protein SO802_012280 [Lithocarpus litseifolius]|uniref:Uncharacterized protein n=1 Tax=Lithocarpus litseifolius TaxID=425828 RepID=A0AAW2D4Y9_9ROSI
MNNITMSSTHGQRSKSNMETLKRCTSRRLSPSPTHAVVALAFIEGMKVEVEEAMELEDQLHKRFKHDPSLLAAMESDTKPVIKVAMEASQSLHWGRHRACHRVCNGGRHETTRVHLEVHVKIANP